MATKTYDPKLVIITFGLPINGYADGTFISVTSSTERFTTTVGADREVTRTRSNDDTAEITITLKQSSASNDYLSTVAELDRTLNLGIRPLQIVDLSGTTLLFWPEAWVQSMPDVEFSNEATDRAWVFKTGQPVAMTIGGNT